MSTNKVTRVQIDLQDRDVEKLRGLKARLDNATSKAVLLKAFNSLEWLLEMQDSASTITIKSADGSTKELAILLL